MLFQPNDIVFHKYHTDSEFKLGKFKLYTKGTDNESYANQFGWDCVVDHWYRNSKELILPGNKFVCFIFPEWLTKC